MSGADGRVALLRGVNVGGNKSVPARALREVAEELGFGEPRTLINSGNLVFRSPAGETELRGALEAAVEARTGVRCEVFVRTADEWRGLISANPFPEAAEDRPSKLLLTVLHEPPASAAVEALLAYAAPGERLVSQGRGLYADFPDGMGRSKMAERLVKLGGTGRNWNTVTRLQAMLEA